MRGALHSLALLLVVALAACTPTSSATSPASPSRSAQPPDGGLATVQQAYAALVTESVLQPRSDVLLSGALAAVSRAVLRTGVPEPRVGLPAFTGDPNGDWQLFVDAYAAAVNRHSSKVPAAELAQEAVRGMAAAVDDCHTSFLDPQEVGEQLAAMRGATGFGGIGASLRKSQPTDPIVVWRVFDETPAARAGLRPGDSILAVDGRDTRDLSVEAAVALIRGPEDSAVQLLVGRGGSADPVELTVTRARISVPSVEARVLPDDLGYVRIDSFSGGVAEEVGRALDDFDRRGVRAWIFDLRSNGGGSLQVETKLLGKLVPTGVLFTLWDRAGQPTDFGVDGAYRGQVAPIVVLVNEGTASGGELFAAAAQDHQLGRVVGTRTAGCVGTGQLIRLPDGSGLQVTVGKLVTGVSKRALNRLGLVPDVEVPLTPDDLVAGRDPQLDEARRLLSR